MGRDGMAVGEPDTGRRADEEQAAEERKDTELDVALRIGGSAAVGAGVGAAFIGGTIATVALAIAGFVVGVLAPRFLSGRTLFHSRKPYNRPS
jgi:hypothetical protein